MGAAVTAVAERVAAAMGVAARAAAGGEGGGVRASLPV